MHLSSGGCFEADAEVRSVTFAKTSRKCYLLSTNWRGAGTFYAIMKVFIKP